MKYNSILILFTMMTLCGCLTDHDDKFREQQPVPAVLIKEVSVSNKTISIEVVYGVTSSGWVYNRTERIRTGNTIYLKGYATPPHEPSLPIMSGVDATVTISVNTAGTYILRFWQSDTTTLDTTATVH